METGLVKQTLPILVSDSLDAYLQRISDIPVLSREEEYALAVEYKTKQSLEAAQQLILSNLKFVAHVVRGYSGYGLSQVDLIQEGNIGLMKAVKKFDPEKNVRLISFAVHWIRAEIHEFVIRNWRMVKIATTKEQRKLFFNLRKNKKRLGWFNDKEAAVVAEKLNVSTATVLEMDKRMGMPEMGFDLPDHVGADEGPSYAPADYLASQDANPELLVADAEEKSTERQDLKYSLSVLDARSRDIVQQRWLQEPKSTLHELAAIYKISAERVRQIEQAAMAKIKSTLEA